MDHPVSAKSRLTRERSPFDCVALLLQGGGALGAYQAGVYQAMDEAGLEPDWIAGISIGAINAAIVAGNSRERRIDRLRQFWQRVSSPPGWGQTAGMAQQASLRPYLAALELSERLLHGAAGAFGAEAPTLSAIEGWRSLWQSAGLAGTQWDPTHLVKGDAARGVLNQLSANAALLSGATGFFKPRTPSPWLWPDGAFEATSYYDTAPLRATLEELVDFDHLNASETRFSVGAVNVRTGNFVYFDSTERRIGPEHVMASGALPPAFPAIEIEGEFYWDGGLVSNTPLHWLMECGAPTRTLAFQVDLWSARGDFPGNMAQVTTRQKEIQYSSRTRAMSDRVKHLSAVRNALATLLEKLPPELKDSAEARLLAPEAERKLLNLVQLIYRSRRYEGDSKDYEFSPRSMEEHWAAGYNDTKRGLRLPGVLQLPHNTSGVAIFDPGEKL
jgi:NTE family protein